MKRGLVIGKFMPVHIGHLALIRFAATQCDELIVSMSHTLSDPINHELRFSWLRDLLSDDISIKIYQVVDDFDNEALAFEDRTKIWAHFIQKTYPTIDILFSSEEYGDWFAKNLNVENVLFDEKRNCVPVSATMIRNDPFQYWQYIPEVVRPYFVKKICIYGPESTGKSTLAIRLAEKFNTVFVPEVAREMLITNDFTVEDIIRIGYAHDERVQEKTKTANKILFCDTDAITTQIYSQYYLHLIPEVLFTLEKANPYDHYFLLDIDVPWIADGLRDLGHKREEMFRIFKQALDDRNLSYTILKGDYTVRLNHVEDWILRRYNLKPERP